MRRPIIQFRLSTLLWITLAVACFFAGIRVGLRQVSDEHLRIERELDYFKGMFVP